MCVKKLNDELNKSLVEYENLEKQLEVIMIQRHQLELQKSEAKAAEKALQDSTGEVYRSVGSILIHATKDSALNDLTERLELIEVKLNAIAKQEEKLRTTVGDYQKKLQEKMKEYGSRPGDS